MEGKMTLKQAIDHTWEVYQKQTLASAWANLEGKEKCEACAEEHKQLHEWLYKLKRIAETYGDYEAGEFDDAVVALEVIGDILKEGEGT